MTIRNEDRDRVRLPLRAARPEGPGDPLAEVQLKDGRRARRLTNFRRSQATKDSWRRKRFNYERGIKRFHRNPLATDIRKRVADRVSRYTAAGAFSGNDENQYEGRTSRAAPGFPRTTSVSSTLRADQQEKRSMTLMRRLRERFLSEADADRFRGPGKDDGLEDRDPLPDDLDEPGDEPFPPTDHPSREDLALDEPRAAFRDEEEDEGHTKTSPFAAFITNQLIDFPVEEVVPTEEEGEHYVDAKFGDRAVSFCLYAGGDGQPMIAVLHDDEVYRRELPPEALSGEGLVRDAYMPVEWIRDILARLVDVAPAFEHRARGRTRPFLLSEALKPFPERCSGKGRRKRARKPNRADRDRAKRRRKDPFR